MIHAPRNLLALSLLTALSVTSVFVAGAAHADPQAGRSVEERRAEVERARKGDSADDSSRGRKNKQSSSEKQPEAAPRFPQATRKEPEGKASAKRMPEMQAMFDAFNAKDYAKVQATADKTIADADANAYEKSISARLAGASLLNTDNVKAQAYLQQALELNGLSNNDHYEAMLLIAQLQMQQQQYAPALASVERFTSETKTQQTPEVLALKGNALYRLKRYPEAEAALKQAIDGNPQPKPEWVQLLIGTYADMGKPEEATKLAEKLGAAGTGSDKQSQLNLAATYMQAGQDAKATEILEKLRAGGQLTEEQDYKNLIAMYSNAGDKEQQVIQIGEEGLQKGILKPDYSVYTALAQAYWFSDQQQKAIEAFQKAAPLAPNGESYLNLARALSNEGRAAEAKEAAKQALVKGVAKPEEANRIISGK